MEVPKCTASSTNELSSSSSKGELILTKSSKTQSNVGGKKKPEHF